LSTYSQKPIALFAYGAPQADFFERHDACAADPTRQRRISPCHGKIGEYNAEARCIQSSGANLLLVSSAIMPQNVIACTSTGTSLLTTQASASSQAVQARTWALLLTYY
jgi:hypothetical protein